MDLKEILSISGKSGLYKVVAQAKNGAIVESLIDKKRFPVFTTDKISSLADISVFCEDSDMPLKDVLKKIYDKEKANPAINPGEGNDKLKLYFEEVLPEYSKERVYVSDIKKIINWYNLLLQNDLLKFEEEPPTAVEEKTENTEVAESENVEEK